jgi:hypothetical protein
MSQRDCGSASWARAPQPSSSRGVSAARLGYKALVTAFIVWHAASVVWWNVPTKALDGDGDARAARLPARLLKAEQKLYDWRSRIESTSRLAQALSAYTLGSATSQSWFFFAPNPLMTHTYLTVSAVLKEGADGKPVYDPTPVYTSYRGTPKEAVARFFDGSAALDPYSFDDTIALGLTGEEFSTEIDPFARYWAQVYTERTGRRPLGVDVLSDEYLVPPFGRSTSRDIELQPWRVGCFRY